MRTWAVLLALVAALSAPHAAAAAEHPGLAKGRALYNAGNYDGAIAAANTARADPASAHAAALVVARAHLERYRLGSSDAADLAAAREALATVRMSALLPRDQIDLLVGLGQALFLTDAFGAAAELFENALGRSDVLPYHDRARLLDWWATAVDRETPSMSSDRRDAALRRVVTRMEEELVRDPGHATANYWLVAASRGIGELDRAWNAAVAAWVRATLRTDDASMLRQDLDRFVTSVLIPERARQRPGREQAAALAELRVEWDTIKEQWR